MNVIFVFPEGFNYQCRGCGRCCRDWNIHVDEPSHQRIVTAGYYEKLTSECGDELFVRDESDGTMSTVRRGSGECVFLDKDTRCVIHREGSYDDKPLGCRQFPFKLIRTPDGIFVGLSFYCESCQRNTGKPLETYQEEMMKWLSQHEYRRIGERDIQLAEGITIDWQGYLLIEHYVAERIRETDVMEDALRKALTGVCILVCRLQKENVTDAASEDVSRLLPAVTGLPDNEVLRESGLFYTAAVAGVMESSTPEGTRANTEAILGGGVLRSEIFGHEISMAGFSRYYLANPCPWKVPHIRRYMEHLVFRKQLLGSEPVLCNLAALFTAYGLLELYLYLSAYQADKPSPDMEDLYFSYGLVEKGFAAHTRTMVPFFRIFAEGFLKLLCE